MLKKGTAFCELKPATLAKTMMKDAALQLRHRRCKPGHRPKRRGQPPCRSPSHLVASTDAAASSEKPICDLAARQKHDRLERAAGPAAPARGRNHSDPSMIYLQSRGGPCCSSAWSPSAPIHLLQWGSEWRKRRGEPDLWHLLLFICSLAGGNTPCKMCLVA